MTAVCGLGTVGTGRPAANVSAAERLCLGALLALLAGVLCQEAWITGITVDEPSHLLSADLYWQGKDVLAPRDMPPLIKIAGGWVPRLLGMPLPPANDPVWRTQHEWPISQRMVELLPGMQAQRSLAWSRMPLTVFPILIAGLLWWWGRQLFSPATGLILALLFALEPTALGHGALFKNDLAASFGYLLFWYGAWIFWRHPGRRQLLLLTLGLAAALLAKLSMLILIPIAAGLVLVRSLLEKHSLIRAVGAAAFVLATIYVLVMAAVQFEGMRLTPAALADLHTHASIPGWFYAAAHVFRILPVPVPLWQGIIELFDSDGSANRIYLFGKVLTGGSPLYFIEALAVKAPAVLQILVAGGAGVLLVRACRRKLEFGWLFIVFPPLLYIGAASMSSLQLGVRLILPALPGGMLIAGAAVEPLRRGRGVWICALLAAALAFSTARVYPHGISFFNIWAGGPENGVKYLSDSNLDWGQDLPWLASYAHQHALPSLRLFYFGNGNPYAYFPPDQLQLLAPPWGDDLVKGTVFQPEPGTYAVSASLLPGIVFATKYQDYFKVFRSMQPIGRAGYSILIYRVDPVPGARKSG